MRFLLDLWNARRYRLMLEGIAACGTNCECCRMLSRLARETLDAK